MQTKRLFAVASEMAEIGSIPLGTKEGATFLRVIGTTLLRRQPRCSAWIFARRANRKALSEELCLRQGRGGLVFVYDQTLSLQVLQNQSRDHLAALSEELRLR